MSVVIELFCVALLLAVGVLAIAARRLAVISFIVYGLSLTLSVIALVTAAVALIGPGSPAATLVLPLGLPVLGAHFRLDALAAFFLCVINLGGASASLYELGHGGHESAPGRVLPLFPWFLAAMNLVVLADDAYAFLLSWELMSLTSWGLVLAHHREGDNTRAAFVYIVMASFGTLALLLALGLLAGSDGGYAFAAMRAGAHPPALAAMVLVLVLLGAGSKAGLVPLHVWLPLAHPAAPSHVSALMSGVMTKVAIYGFLRIVLDLLGMPSWWSAMIVLALGGITAVMGVLYALMQTDLKRLLAYSTVENIGIIFVGIGLAMAFQSAGTGWAAALALTAALLHVLNHSMFKSLLFFGAGAVLTATGERDIEKLGGLIHRMPVASFAFLIGSVAISALPPFNGFVSEWLTFQAILVSPDLPQWGLKILIPGLGAALALAAALAAACFVRAFGITFQGRPRTPAAANAMEVDRLSLAAMLLLAALCLITGTVPGPWLDALAPVTQALVGIHMPTQTSLSWLSIVPIDASHSSFNGLLTCLFILASASLAACAIHRLASRAVRRGPAWGCGFPDGGSPAIQYTASSFAQPIRRVFGSSVFAAREHVDMPAPGDNRPARFSVDLRDPVWESVYLPVAAGVRFAADRLNALQFLTIRRYLSFVFVTLVLLLLVLVIWL